MERKYYLRGLGLGILVTAIIMTVAQSGSRTMTNDEIIARAKELGLVENTVLSDLGDVDGSQDIEVDDRADDLDVADQSQGDLAAAGSVVNTDSEDGDDAAKEDEEEAVAEGDTAFEANDVGQGSAHLENALGEENAEPEDVIVDGQKDKTIREENNARTENANETITPATVKVITVNSGDSSYTVAKKLADAGVVISAEDFDTFLCQNGYDKRLRTGNFSIPTDASDEQIARIVTGLE